MVRACSLLVKFALTWCILHSIGTRMALGSISKNLVGKEWTWIGPPRQIPVGYIVPPNQDGRVTIVPDTAPVAIPTTPNPRGTLNESEAALIQERVMHNALISLASAASYKTEWKEDDESPYFVAGESLGNLANHISHAPLYIQGLMYKRVSPRSIFLYSSSARESGGTEELLELRCPFPSDKFLFVRQYILDKTKEGHTSRVKLTRLHVTLGGGAGELYLNIGHKEIHVFSTKSALEYLFKGLKKSKDALTLVDFVNVTKSPYSCNSVGLKKGDLTSTIICDKCTRMPQFHANLFASKLLVESPLYVHSLPGASKSKCALGVPLWIKKAFTKLNTKSFKVPRSYPEALCMWSKVVAVVFGSHKRYLYLEDTSTRRMLEVELPRSRFRMLSKQPTVYLDTASLRTIYTDKKYVLKNYQTMDYACAYTPGTKSIRLPHPEK